VKTALQFLFEAEQTLLNAQVSDSEENEGMDSASSRKEKQEPHLSRKERSEVFMEAVAASGAEKIASMSISERTKRAMLAEALEDRIFQLQDDLENLIPDGSTIPTDEQVRSHCVDIAQEIKHAQGQYNDLVSGKPSDILDKLESLGGPATDDGNVFE